MKKVLKTGGKDVSIADTSLNKFYGVKVFDDKCFIARRFYGFGEFTLLMPKELTNGNGIFNYDSLDLQEMLDNIIAQNNEVFEFSTFKELTEWLME